MLFALDFYSSHFVKLGNFLDCLFKEIKGYWIFQIPFLCPLRWSYNVAVNLLISLCRLKTAHVGFEYSIFSFIPRMKLIWLTCLTLFYTAEFYLQKPILCFWVYVENQIHFFLFSGTVNSTLRWPHLFSLLEVLTISSRFWVFKGGFWIHFQISVVIRLFWIDSVQLLYFSGTLSSSYKLPNSLT